MVKDDCKIMKDIGGYFQLELDYRDGFLHDNGLLVNTGRNALELILSQLPIGSKVFIPKFTCDVILEPFVKLGIQYSFYSVNRKLEISELLNLGSNDYLLYTNYFGVKDAYVKRLIRQYPSKLIIDNAQALYAEPTEKCFYSPRKFVGIPDGGVAFINSKVDMTAYEQDYSYERCMHLLKRIDINAGAGYQDFKQNATQFKNQSIKKMSNLTKALLSSIDFDKVKMSRLQNFKYLHSILGKTNQLDIDDFGDFACPMVYPFMSDDIDLRDRLIRNKLFVATYWPNVLDWSKETSNEYILTKKIIPVPIDQRYTIEEMDLILKLI